MTDYAIFTDSSCDMSAQTLSEWDVESVSLIFSDRKTEYLNDDMTAKEFYAKMKAGTVFFTSAPAPDSFEKAFRRAVEAGKDILYIGFSSGLSNTFAAAEIAAGTIQPDFPDRQMVCIDSLCASAGQGLLLYLAVQNRRAGMSLEENAAYIRDHIMKICHWFTVDDLSYLKRGGRVSATAALAGTVLDIKPVLHVDDEGHLINMKKVRGRKKSIAEMADKYTELADDPDNGVYFISHGDCLEDAKAVEELINKKHGHRAEIITNVGPVIGSHTGPSVIALFFIGKHR